MSDRSVSGLLRGLFAGLVMAGFLVLAGVLGGAAPLQALNWLSPSVEMTALQGLLAHLGISAVYGILFGVFWGMFPRRWPGWLAGLLYGLALFALANFIILPRTNSGMAQVSALVLLLAHLLYGLALGYRK